VAAAIIVLQTHLLSIIFVDFGSGNYTFVPNKCVGNLLLPNTLLILILIHYPTNVLGTEV